jgi:hypothetical protein
LELRPACLLDEYWNFHAHNDASRVVLGADETGIVQLRQIALAFPRVTHHPPGRAVAWSCTPASRHRHACEDDRAHVVTAAADPGRMIQAG